MNLAEKSIAGAGAAWVNHLLAGATWASDKLRAFAGRRVVLQLPAATLSYRIQDTGFIEAADLGEAESGDISAHVTLSQAARFATGDRSIAREIEFSGDAEFANELAQIAQALEWDVEEDLSRVVGDVAAHRIVGLGSAFQSWQRDARDRFAEAFKEYFTEEQPLIAKRRDLEQFSAQVVELRDALERLEKRIEHLERAPSIDTRAGPTS